MDEGGRGRGGSMSDDRGGGVRGVGHRRGGKKREMKEER